MDQYFNGQLVIYATCSGIEGETGQGREERMGLREDAEFFGVSCLNLVLTPLKASLVVTTETCGESGRSALQHLTGGWRSYVVYTNEVISGIWRANDAMPSLRSS